jgi:hypothetical protein
LRADSTFPGVIRRLRPACAPARIIFTATTMGRTERSARGSSAAVWFGWSV